MSITPDQVAVIGFVSIFMVQVIKLIAAAKGKDIGRKTVTWMLIVLSFILALVFAKPVFPAFPIFSALPAGPVIQGEPFDVIFAILGWVPIILGVALDLFTAVIKYLLAIVQIITVYAGFAAVIYNVVMEKVFDGLGWTKDKVIGK